MDYFALGKTALGLLLDAIAAAKAANDDKAVADLEALIADSTVGRRLVAKAADVRGVIADGHAMIAAAEVASPVLASSAPHHALPIDEG